MDGFQLVGLTPEYQESEHGAYVEALIEATDRKHELLRNIALSGTYGSGKSSILSEVARQKSDTVLTISLASLGADEEVKTPAIQKEILKQILYRVPPRRLPASRFRRPSERSVLRLLEDGLAVLVVVGFVISALLRVNPLADFDELPLWKARVPLAALGGAVLLVTFHATGLFLTHRVRTGQLKAGPAILDLKDQSDSYFDDWLDEIIYVFEVSGTKLVIFEDLDRFENPGIFDDLRDLNSVLNNAQQITRRRLFKDPARVQFIYAIRDSVFVDANEGSDSIAAAADRAKFFDLIVPVAPFITAESADSHLWKVARQLVPDISDALVEIAAETIFDMRVIKNIRNEFLMMQRIVLDGPTAIKSLTGESLFAMIVYKNLHLADYEDIQRGESNLDELYRMSQVVATAEISKIDRTLASDRIQPRVDQRAREARDKLVAYSGTTFRRLGAEASDRIKFSIDDEEIDSAEFAKPEIWTRLSTGGGTLYVEADGHEESLTLAVNDLREIIGREVGPNTWEAEATELSATDRVELEARRTELSTGGIAALIVDQAAKLSVGDEDELEEISFAEYCERNLDSPQALALITHGFVDDDFPLYVSKYEDARVSKEAKRYLIQNVRRDIYNPYVPLGSRDVTSILARSDSAEPFAASLLNVSIVNHIVKSSPAFHAGLASRLIDGSEVSTEFLMAYFANGDESSSLVALMAPTWSDGFDSLCGLDALPELQRIELVGSLLAHADPSNDYSAKTETVAFVEAALPRLEPFVSGHDESFARPMEVLENLGVAAISLAEFSESALQAFVAGARFKVTGENLKMALPGAALSLDAIKAENEAVYEVVVRGLSSYADFLSASKGKIPPIADQTNFAEVLTDIAAHPESASRIIGMVPDSFTIERLADVPAAVWPGLLKTGRAKSDIANCLGYFERQGWDDILVEFMSRAAPSTADVEDVDPAARQAFAHAVVGTDNGLKGGATRRVTIIRRAKPPASLELEHIPIDSGPLIRDLLIAGLIDEGADLFRHLSKSTWEVRERALASTKNYADYVELDLISDRDIGLLFASSRVPYAVKTLYFGAVDTLVRQRGIGATAAVRWAARIGRIVSPDEYRVLAGVSTDRRSLFLVLASSSPRWTDEDVNELTSALGAPYSHLASNFRRPVVPDSPAVQSMLDRMRGTWPIVSYSQIGDGNLRVSNKRSFL